MEDADAEPAKTTRATAVAASKYLTPADDKWSRLLARAKSGRMPFEPD
jgi:hypothetical protein